MIQIYNATVDDIAGISEVQKETWLSTYPNEEFGITKEDILSEDFFSGDRIESRKKIINNQNSNTKFWVAKDEGKVIGYCCARKEATSNTIKSLYVLPLFQGKGIGQMLIEKAFDFLDMKNPTKLAVAIYNQNAISFYERLGFKKGKRFDKNPEGPFITGKEIPEMEMIKEPTL